MRPIPFFSRKFLHFRNQSIERSLIPSNLDNFKIFPLPNTQKFREYTLSKPKKIIQNIVFRHFSRENFQFSETKLPNHLLIPFKVTLSIFPLSKSSLPPSPRVSETTLPGNSPNTSKMLTYQFSRYQISQTPAGNLVEYVQAPWIYIYIYIRMLCIIYTIFREILTHYVLRPPSSSYLISETWLSTLNPRHHRRQRSSFKPDGTRGRENSVGMDEFPWERRRLLLPRAQRVYYAVNLARVGSRGKRMRERKL